MTFQSLRSTWMAIGLGLITAVLLTSCGGGGAAATNTGGTLQVFVPNSMYGGVAATITITGGRAPYVLASSEPGVLPVPSQTNSTQVTVLPANPGIIDTGLPPGSLPVRTVNVSVRDANGGVATGTTKVGQNFLTGYGISFGATSCTPPAGSSSTTSAGPCSGGDTVAEFQDTFNGNLNGDREFEIDVTAGPITLVNQQTGASGKSINVTSDHSGNVSFIVRGAPNQGTQIATVRVLDVATGVQTFENFIVTGTAANGALTLIPASFTFTGPDTATCGTGTGDFFVFDGTPPYAAFASDPNLSITYIDPNHNPGRFSVTASNPNVCLTTATVLVTDAVNARGTLTVTTAKGSTAAPTPATPLQVQPNSLTLSCGQTGSVLAIGGSSSGSSTTYSAASTNGNISTAVNGGTISITAFSGAAPGAGTGASTYTVNVTDGSTVVPVTVHAPTTCP